MRITPFAVTAAFAAGALSPARAQAADVNVEVFEFLRHLPTHHLLYLAVAFLLIGLVAKSRESSLIIVLGSFLLTAICLGSFLIFTLTGDLMNKPPPARAYEKVMMAEVNNKPIPPLPTARAAAPVPIPGAARLQAAEGKLGASCHKEANCGEGTLCSKVAGARKCWLPCGAGGSCEPGFACMIAVSGPSVCVR